MSNYRRLLALGDSFCEGVGDVEPQCPNGVRGFADRVAAEFAARDPEFRYANLAIRGRLTEAALTEQLPRARELRPDLVFLSVGGNDMARPSVDIDDVVARIDDAIGEFQSWGARVVTFSMFDTGGKPVFTALRGRFAIYNELLREVIERRGATLVDFWRMSEYRDRRLWEFDRMHMSPAGHQRMAAAVLEALGLPWGLQTPEFRPEPDRTPGQQRKENRQWAAQAALPWVSRRIRGVSTGDPLTARYPDWTELVPVAETA